MPSRAPPPCHCKLISGCLSGVQGLPEGHTEACYPIMRPGLDGHRAPPLRDSDSERREVSGLLGGAPTAAVLAEAAIDALFSGLQRNKVSELGLSWLPEIDLLAWNQRNWLCGLPCVNPNGTTCCGDRWQLLCHLITSWWVLACTLPENAILGCCAA